MRIAFYARVSTQHQAQAQTIDQQLTRLQAHAQQQGWTVDEADTYRDEGHSGARLNRPALDRLRDRVALAAYDTVLITAPDRLARQFVHQVLLVEEFRQRGCALTFLDRPMSQDPHDQLVLQIRGAVAEYERALITERLRRGRLARLQGGTLLPWAIAPYGYRTDPTRPRDPAGVQPDPLEAPIVRELFAAYLEPGMAVHQLVVRLARDGVPTPSGRGCWRVGTVRYILRNPIYAGMTYGNRFRAVPARARASALQPVGAGKSHVARPAEEWVGVPVPALVAPDTFARVQAKLDVNRQCARRNAAYDYLLRGLVSCGRCQLSMTGRPANGRTKVYHYYGCRGHAERGRVARGERCPSRFVPAAQLDETVWRDLSALLLEPAHLVAALERAQGGHWVPQELQARQQALAQALAQAARQQERLLAAYLAELIDLEAFGRKRQGLSQHEAGLQAQQRQLATAVAQRRQAAELAAGLEAFRAKVAAGLAAAGPAERRALVELLIDRVVVTDDHLEIRYAFPTTRDGPHQPFCHLRLNYFGDERAKERAEFQELMPIGVRARQPRHLHAEDEPDMVQADLGDEPLKPEPPGATRARFPEIVINDHNPGRRPAQEVGTLGQAILEAR